MTALKRLPVTTGNDRAMCDSYDLEINVVNEAEAATLVAWLRANYPEGLRERYTVHVGTKAKNGDEDEHGLYGREWGACVLPLRQDSIWHDFVVRAVNHFRDLEQEWDQLRWGKARRRSQEPHKSRR